MIDYIKIYIVILGYWDYEGDSREILGTFSSFEQAVEFCEKLITLFDKDKKKKYTRNNIDSWSKPYNEEGMGDYLIIEESDLDDESQLEYYK